VRDASNVMVAASNLRQVGVALNNYHTDHRQFPPAIRRAADGRPLLSWRVLILPYLDAESLYNEFRLDEPWYSEHNLKLLPKMPDIYKPVGNVVVPPHHTFLQLFVGPGAVFDETGKAPTIGKIARARGASNTLLAAESGWAVPWTKPEDIPFDPKTGPGLIGGQFPGEFRLYAVLKGERRSRPITNLLLVDGSIRTTRTDENKKYIHTSIQWQHVEVVEFKD
jgi:hypothetical protein